MRYLFRSVLAITLLSSTMTSSQAVYATATGVVVAVQKAKDEVRMTDPASMGDMVEVWMLHIKKWTRAEKPGFILVEYTHRDPIVSDDDLDQKNWTFELRPAPASQRGTCMSWWPTERAFVPTSFGAHSKLPPPDALPCFLMHKHPVAIDGHVERKRN